MDALHNVLPLKFESVRNSLPSTYDSPINGNSMRHMLVTAKIFPFIFREAPRESLPLGFFSVYLFHNHLNRFCGYCIFVTSSSFSCSISFFLFLFLFFSSFSGVFISMMLLHSMQSNIALGVGIEFGSQVEPSSHEIIERTLSWNLEDLSWSWFFNYL